MTTSHSRLSGRAFAVFGVTLAFAIMLVSGLLLYVAPRGRLATEIDWQLLGLGRSGWEGLHLATSFLFMGLVFWHFLAHIRFYGTCLKGTPMHPAGHRLEAVAAVLLVAGIAIAALANWPPSSWAIESGDYFKRVYWDPAGGPGHK